MRPSRMVPKTSGFQNPQTGDQTLRSRSQSTRTSPQALSHLLPFRVSVRVYVYQQLSLFASAHNCFQTWLFWLKVVNSIVKSPVVTSRFEHIFFLPVSRTERCFFLTFLLQRYLRTRKDEGRRYYSSPFSFVLCPIGHPRFGHLLNFLILAFSLSYSFCPRSQS